MIGYTIVDRATRLIIATDFSTFEEADRYRRLLGGKEKYAIVSW
jgi:hypothetical protein